MKTTVLPERDACPLCGHWLDAATAGPSNPDATPKPGDITVCIQCVSVLVFDEDLRVRVPTDAEQAEAMALHDVVTVVQAIRDVLGMRR